MCGGSEHRENPPTLYIRNPLSVFAKYSQSLLSSSALVPGLPEGAYFLFSPGVGGPAARDPHLGRHVFRRVPAAGASCLQAANLRRHSRLGPPWHQGDQAVPSPPQGGPAGAPGRLGLGRPPTLGYARAPSRPSGGFRHVSGRTGLRDSSGAARPVSHLRQTTAFRVRAAVTVSHTLCGRPSGRCPGGFSSSSLYSSVGGVRVREVTSRLAGPHPRLPRPIPRTSAWAEIFRG
jgi:hypothetical protein